MPPVVVYHKYWFSSLAEHYVFPDDRPAEDQHEVRTVEEESLFHAAYPEVVESYLRDKALAEENKTKSKTMSYKSLLVHKHTIFSAIYFLWNSPCSPPTNTQTWQAPRLPTLCWQGGPDQRHLELWLVFQGCLLQQPWHLKMQSLAVRLVHTPKALMQPRGVCLRLRCHFRQVVLCPPSPP